MGLRHVGPSDPWDLPPMGTIRHVMPGLIGRHGLMGTHGTHGLTSALMDSWTSLDSGTLSEHHPTQWDSWGTHGNLGPMGPSADG